MYITYAEYTALYDDLEEKAFNRLVYDACVHMDNLTTGVDGVKKLQVAFPKNEADSLAVKRCAASVVYILSQVNEAEKSASIGRAYKMTPNGLKGGVIASVTAGNESVTYTSGTQTPIDMAANNPAEKCALIAAEIRRYLSGVSDANGVSLLYLGRYPVKG